MMGQCPKYYIPNFKEIGPPVPEENIFEGFLPYIGVADMSSIILINFHFHMPKRLHTKFGIKLEFMFMHPTDVNQALKH